MTISTTAPTRADAQALDAADPLAGFRDRYLPTTADVLGALDLTGWTVERAEAVALPMPATEGAHGERFDHVIRLRRDRRVREVSGPRRP